MSEEKIIYQLDQSYAENRVNHSPLHTLRNQEPTLSTSDETDKISDPESTCQ